MRSVVFTTAEGALLDPETFDAGANITAVQRLQAADVPVIPMTAMTLAEIAPIAGELGMQHAMVIEAGAAIARWLEGGWKVEACGPSGDTLLEVIREIEDRSHADLIVQSGDVFSEPFLIERGDLRDVVAAASAIGFSLRRGGRFFHLCRDSDAGACVARLKHEMHCDVAVAIASSLQDADFLSRADIPIIIPGADGKPDAELLANVPNARVAPAPAPGGWAAAIEDVWPNVISPSRTR